MLHLMLHMVCFYNVFIVLFSLYGCYTEYTLLLFIIVIYHIKTNIYDNILRRKKYILVVI